MSKHLRKIDHCISRIREIVAQNGGKVPRVFIMQTLKAEGFSKTGIEKALSMTNYLTETIDVYPRRVAIVNPFFGGPDE